MPIGLDAVCQLAVSRLCRLSASASLASVNLFIMRSTTVGAVLLGLSLSFCFLPTQAAIGSSVIVVSGLRPMPGHPEITVDCMASTGMLPWCSAMQEWISRAQSIIRPTAMLAQLASRCVCSHVLQAALACSTTGSVDADPTRACLLHTYPGTMDSW